MKPTIWLGLAVNTISLLIASFVSDISLLILFQGVGPGEMKHHIFGGIF